MYQILLLFHLYNKSLVTSEISDHKKQQMKTKEIICTLLFLASIGVIIGRDGKYFLIKTQNNSTGLDETDLQDEDYMDLYEDDDMVMDENVRCPEAKKSGTCTMSLTSKQGVGSKSRTEENRLTDKNIGKKIKKINKKSNSLGSIMDHFLQRMKKSQGIQCFCILDSF